MNLLILLSALLSALTGVVQGGRVERAPQALSALAVAAGTVPAAATIATRRPVNAPASLMALSGCVSGYCSSLNPVEPLYARRRRE